MNKRDCEVSLWCVDVKRRNELMTDQLIYLFIYLSRYVNVCILFIPLCVNTALCENTGKELPGRVMLITKSTRVTP